MQGEPAEKKARSNILVRASKAPEKSLVEVEVDVGATVKDLAVALGNKLGTDASVIVVICRGAVLKDLGAPLRAAAAAGFGEDGVLSIVFMARGPKAAVAPNSAPVPKAAPAAPTPAAAAPTAEGSEKGGVGYRQILLIRHGQCCHEGEHDELKALTAHGHKQAEETAAYLKALFCLHDDEICVGDSVPLRYAVFDFLFFSSPWHAGVV